ncbi:cryptochrome/photolyase family protein [Wohlfahrtiimonas chitiniclastica]|uniref:cryptochrome/photolyase family protein n=1 Tax=Wohlfahrtiimonas chitiniclastica TaxID=400946 RepID=UPI000571669F|nr:FAD-binding domain-containing protein [Wohlfahrtiimonas chitiniclastica]
MRSLMWFRSDLRIHDNEALYKATQNQQAIALFIIAHEDWQKHHDAKLKLAFMWRNLQALQKALDHKNIPLKIIEVDSWAQIPERINQLMLDHQISSLYFNHEVGINEVERDRAVYRQLKKSGFKINHCHDKTLVKLGSILNGDNNPYKVFTAFKKRLIEVLEHQPFENDCEIPVQVPTGLTSDDIQVNPYQAFDDLAYQAGEDAAFGVLQDFLKEDIFHYHNHRDIPAIDGTSRLSPYLAQGVVSVKALLREALILNEGHFKTGDEGILTWMNELYWREFYYHIMWNFPNVSKNRAFQEKTEKIQWRDNEADFDAWKNGKTGVPIVDAFMRQLKATGWMHNRGRMITAMFLTKNLLIDWRKGEAWFMQNLIDGDFAANNGGWQWSASTGTDAVPYFRIFNPVTQSERFDPKGDFIRQWCPELSHLDHQQIHKVQKNVIVDLKSSRIRAIEAFKRLSE